VIAQAATYRRNGLCRQGYESDTTRRVLTLDNALNITPRIFITDAAGPEAGCTAALVRMPVPDIGTGCRRTPETERNSQRCA
jgi:hypothetical protein